MANGKNGKKKDRYTEQDPKRKRALRIAGNRAYHRAMSRGGKGEDPDDARERRLRLMYKAQKKALTRSEHGPSTQLRAMRSRDAARDKVGQAQEAYHTRRGPTAKKFDEVARRAPAGSRARKGAEALAKRRRKTDVTLRAKKAKAEKEYDYEKSHEETVHKVVESGTAAEKKHPKKTYYQDLAERRAVAEKARGEARKKKQAQLKQSERETPEGYRVRKGAEAVKARAKADADAKKPPKPPKTEAEVEKETRKENIKNRDQSSKYGHVPPRLMRELRDKHKDDKEALAAALDKANREYREAGGPKQHDDPETRVKEHGTNIALTALAPGVGPLVGGVRTAIRRYQRALKRRNLTAAAEEKIRAKLAKLRKGGKAIK